MQLIRLKNFIDIVIVELRQKVHTMVSVRFFSSLLTLGLSLNALAFFDNTTEVDGSIKAMSVSQEQSVLAEGFDPPNDEERPGSTVG